MTPYNYRKPKKTSLNVNKWEIGESMEMKMRRILTNKEQIKDNVPISYSAPTEGVLSQYDIKNDKFETAINSLDQNARNNAMKSQSIGDIANENMKKEQESEGPGGSSSQGEEKQATKQ